MMGVGIKSMENVRAVRQFEHVIRDLNLTHVWPGTQSSNKKASPNILSCILLSRQKRFRLRAIIL